MPSPTQAVCSPFLPLAHLPFSTRQADRVSRHLQTPRDRRVPPLPPGPDSPGWELRTQPCSQGGAGFPHLVLAGPPEAGCVLLACRGHSCKRPGCEVMWRLSWPWKVVQEAPGQSWASGTDHKCVSRVLALHRAEEPDLGGPPQTRSLWGLPQLDKGLARDWGA